MLQCVFISEKRLLVQMRTDRKCEYYWTILNPNGKIFPLTRRLHYVLHSQCWTKVESFEIHDGLRQLVLQTDQASRFAVFVFNRKGHTVRSRIFDEQISLLAPVTIPNSEEIRSSYDGRIYRVGILQRNPANGSPDQD